MRRNFIDEPYIEKDAQRYLEMLKNYGDTPAPAFAEREHVTPGVKSSSDPQSRGPGTATGNAKTAINILRTIVKEVHGIYYDANRVGGSNFQVQELGRYIAFRCQLDFIPGPVKSHKGAY